MIPFQMQFDPKTLVEERLSQANIEIESLETRRFPEETIFIVRGNYSGYQNPYAVWV